MSKITFRADDELVDAVEALDASKSEVMRDALRSYLNVGASREAFGHRAVEESLDEIVTRRVEAVLDDRLDDRDRGHELTLRVQVDGAESATTTPGDSAKTATGPSDTKSDGSTPSHDGPAENTCPQCGSDLDTGHEFCPTCGERAAQDIQCECGEALERTWSFCPACGRRAATVEYLER